VTCEDFVAAVADANERDLDQFRRWYSQAGTPRVKADGHWDATTRTYTLHLAQWCPASPGQPVKQPLHIPVAVGLIGSDGRELAHRLLELTGKQQTFIFEHIDPGPTADGQRFVVPSLLRNLSAPVVLEHDADDALLAFQLAHDTDAFNRWEASQRLAVSAILRVLAGEAVEQAAAHLVDALGQALARTDLDPASEGFVVEQLELIDPQALRAARNAVRDHIGTTLAPALRSAFDAMRASGAYSPDPVATGQRSLRNATLGLLTASGVPGADELARWQFEQADNMTDRLAAVNALAHSSSRLRDVVLNDFGAEFAQEPLVMDKWFALQATLHRQADDGPVIDRVHTLMHHPAFSMRNPNKVRALIASFCSGNLAEFHAADGSGYRFWTEQVLALDASNPQMAARLSRALDRWRKFDAPRQSAMRAALENVAQHARSPDVLEVVGKALS
jgi:aminopeptidase N